MRKSLLVPIAIAVSCALAAPLTASADEAFTSPKAQASSASAASAVKEKKAAKHKKPLWKDRDWRVKGGATFNVPQPWGTWAQQTQLVRTIEAAINHVPKRTKKHPEPTITIASYLLDRRTSADALIAACRRGVSVRLILDQDVINPTSRRLFRVFNADNVKDKNHDGKPDHKAKRGPCDTPLKKKKKNKNNDRVSARTFIKGNIPTADSVTWGKDRSYAMYCKSSCRGRKTESNMHSKFFLFNESGADKDVVMVSSSNLNAGGVQNGWNDLYTVKNDEKFYNGFVTVHRAMTEDIPATKKKVQLRSGPYVARFFPMKHANVKNDPVIKDLKKIRCQSDFGPTQLNVSMFYWKGKRGNHITDKLFSLARSGCKLAVIMGAPSNQMYARLRTAAINGLITLYDSRYGERWNEEDQKCVPISRTHGKYLLVKGTYRGDRSAYVVMTGSPNWVGGSLAVGDEDSLNVEKKSAYNAYLANWNAVRAHSERKPARSARDLCETPTT